MESRLTGRVFRTVVNSKDGETLHKSSGLIYSRLRELLLEKISMLGMDPRQFGMHSLRAGGATAAANAGVPLRGMADGGLSQLRTAMSRTRWTVVYLCLRVWGFNDACYTVFVCLCCNVLRRANRSWHQMLVKWGGVIAM